MVKHIGSIIACALILSGTVSAWVEGTQQVGMTLPYSGTIATDSVAFRIINTGIGTGGWFQVKNADSDNPALVAISNGGGPALRVTPSSRQGMAAEFNGEVHFEGEVTKEYTNGTSNRAVPTAYGYINHYGNVVNATPNVSSTWISTNKYYAITITGETYQADNWVTVLTPVGNDGPINVYTAVTSIEGKMCVQFYSETSDWVQHGFYFVTFKL